MMESLVNLLKTQDLSYHSVELAKAFLVFMSFSFIGWICEVLYVGIFFEHKFINRGFLHGPICPIYGAGGVLILTLPEKLQSPIWVLFLSGLFFCSLVEYISSWAMERMFHAKWWDYSAHCIRIFGKKIPTNINGRVCLKNSLLFGLMTVCVIRFIQPLIVKLFSLVNDTSTICIANALAILLIVDLISTVRKLVDFSVYIIRLKDFGESLKERYKNEEWFRSNSLQDIFESIHEHTELEKEKFSESLLAKIESFNARRKHFESFVRRFPTMKSKNYAESLLHLRNRIAGKIKEKM